ncbi:hypothetical protein AAG906_033928 [Vitis piasezkii]
MSGGIKEVTTWESSKAVEEQSKIDGSAERLNTELSTSDSFALESSKQASQSGWGTGRSTGRRRAKVAYTCLYRLHKLLAKEIEDGREINGKTSEVDNRSASSLLRWMGSRAVVVVDAEKIVVANCGDLRAVQYSRGVQPSRDH